MDINTYITLDATDMANMIKKKEVTAEELVSLAFKQLDKVNPDVHAVVHERRAKALEEAVKAEEKDTPFAGVPMLLKDISQGLKGEPLTAGAKLLQSVVAENDSHFVQRMRDAGVLFLGHTTTPEFALKNISEPAIYEAVRNPWNTDYSPGGSSGGSAAAIAAGVVPVAGASDGGGSIRIPASFTGLFGLKPTRGRTPVGPGAGRQWQGASIDFVLSRTVRDSAAMLDVQQVVQPEAAFQTPLFAGKYTEAMRDDFTRPLRIGYTTKSPVGTPVSEDAVKAVEKTVKWLQAQGHDVEETDNGVDGVQLMRDYFLMNSGEISAVMAQIEGAIGRAVTAKDVEIETWLLNQAGKSVSAAEFSASLASWDNAAAQMAAFHQTYDFYLTPATAYTAPEIGELTMSKQIQEELCLQIDEISKQEQQSLIYDMFLPSMTYTPFTQLANLTGQPGISLPVHLSEKGLPIGVQMMASKGEEHRLLRLAHQIEQSELWIGMKGNPMLA